jgi:hypothetical protein
MSYRTGFNRTDLTETITIRVNLRSSVVNSFCRMRFLWYFFSQFSSFYSDFRFKNCLQRSLEIKTKKQAVTKKSLTFKYRDKANISQKSFSEKELRNAEGFSGT